MQRWGFIHIPKTAGTSFRRGIDQLLGPDATSRDYGPNSPETSREVLRAVYEAGDNWRLWREMQAREKFVIVGHVKLMKYQGILGTRNFFSFVREPVQRVVSEYCHFVKHHNFRESLLNFAGQPRFIDRQSKMLAGVPIAAIGLVGLTERYDESLDLFDRLFGLKLPSLEENLGRSRIDVPHEISKTEEQKIKELNARDIELYSRVRTMFDHRVLVASSGKSYVRGEISDLKSGKIRGWAVDDFDDEPAELEVLIDNSSVGVVRAKDYRAGLAMHGFRRSGYVGFIFKLPRLEAGMRIRVCDAKTGVGLTNSPLRVAPGLV